MMGKRVGNDMTEDRTWVNLISFRGRFFAFTGARSIASSVESAPSMTFVCKNDQ